ncbi:hypothetical protein G9A89_009008 [Geosiphon pyriformis]|nr:hypothetical protein G9A89_009008 [Geosiphon pyriformis]
MKRPKKFPRLARKTSHRVSMVRNMVTALIKHDRIKTTLPKAEALVHWAEKMVTLAKKGTTSAAIRAMAFLRETEVTMPKLYNEMVERYKNRSGGYTRVHKLGYRPHDHAPMGIIEYVDAPGDLKYSMLIKTLARMELEPSLRISSQALENGQGGGSKWFAKKKAVTKLKMQAKLDRNVRKMMKAKKMTKKQLNEEVAKEADRLIEVEKEMKEAAIKVKLRRKKGHLSYAPED